MDLSYPSTAPTPVTLLRLVAAAKRLDITYAFSNMDSEEPRLSIRHEGAGSTTVQLESVPQERCVLTLNLPGAASFEALREISEFVNEWNHDCLSPTLMLNVADLEYVTLWARTSFSTVHGLNDKQIDAHLSQAMSTTTVLLDEISRRFPELLVRDKSIPLAIHNSAPAPKEEPAVKDSSLLPRPVTVERLRDTLASLGVVNVREVPGTGIGTSINGMTFLFLLDNGPSLVTKGHWDPNWEAAEFTRLFLVCNDFNRDSASVTAFCHTNEAGLQVRMDSITPIGEGLNDEQLTSLLGSAIRELLIAADRITREAGAESPVEWPDVP